MARLDDPERLKAYVNALSNWEIEGYVRFELTEQSHKWIRQELGVILDAIRELMHQHVLGGGEVDEVRETRPMWADQYQFHYDLRLSIQGKTAYLETRLHFRSPFVPDEPWILVVNVHQQ